MKVNPILLEVFKNRFSAIAEEMGAILQKTAFSANIKERKDFSCAVFDENGDMIAQAAHIPVHLGSMPMSVKSAIENVKLEEGDMVVLNDPYKGGTHLPDITIVAPVFIRDRDKPSFYVANRAHHADIGGISAGSMPLSTSIFQEGINIPPIKLVKRGKVDEEILNFIKNNVRTPEEREGDFKSQISANLTGIKRLKELCENYSLDTVKFYGKELISYAEKYMKSIIENIPDGMYEAEDFIEDDGIDSTDIKIHVSINIKGDRCTVDFSKSDKQVKGALNAVHAITASAVYYVFRALAKEDIPTNAGCFRPIEVITEKGTIVDATFPSAVSAGNVETSQRVVDVVLKALSKALPQEIPAASQGTMNNITIGIQSLETGEYLTYYETIGGGMGASAKGDGESAIQSHMTNTLNTPIEALEFEYPLMITKYSIRKNSGGEGLYKGGDGIVREFLFLNDAEVTIISERRKIAPYGLFGGNSGETGRNIHIRENKEEILPGKCHLTVKKGEKIRIETPGGGGFEKPQEV